MSFLKPVIDHLTTFPHASTKAMGYVREISGIRRRYLRVRLQWASHVEHCQEIIRQGMDRATQHRKAVILGAGLMHDIPLDDLCRQFREVILADIYHPFASRWETRRYPNLRRVTFDITNTVANAYRVAWDRDEPLPVALPTLFLDDPEVDFTASVNLLSQLPCMPMTYLQHQHVHSQEKILAYVRHLLTAHMEYLRQLPGVVTLITDVRRLKYTLMNKLVESRDLFFDVPPPSGGQEWEWRLAPCPEADDRHHYFRHVVGIADWKTHSAGVRESTKDTSG
ncbi:hypothetical protein [Zavarzinella formosa]|uniref:hypothetical protein n=1 Tax=Zavarzinella formosa TaxID=360055 RepID=UPI0002F1861D|nr:hypothetical protein [Zavarzinella formosa]